MSAMMAINQHTTSPGQGNRNMSVSTPSREALDKRFKGTVERVKESLPAFTEVWEDMMKANLQLAKDRDCARKDANEARERIYELEDEIQNLRRELEQVKTEYSKERDACSFFSKEKSQLTHELKGCRDDINMLKQQNATLNQEYQRVTAQKAELERQLETIRSKPINHDFNHRVDAAKSQPLNTLNIPNIPQSYAADRSLQANIRPVQETSSVIRPPNFSSNGADSQICSYSFGQLPVGSERNIVQSGFSTTRPPNMTTNQPSASGSSNPSPTLAGPNIPQSSLKIIERLKRFDKLRSWSDEKLNDMIVKCKRDQYGGHFGRMKMVDVVKAVAEFIEATYESGLGLPPSINSTLPAPENQQQSLEGCPICLEKLEMTGKLTTKLECGHQFHQGCLEQWHEQVRECPICRRVALSKKEFPPLN